MSESDAPRSSGHTIRWYLGWMLALVVAVGGVVIYGANQASQAEEARKEQKRPVLKHRLEHSTKRRQLPDGTVVEEKFTTERPANRQVNVHLTPDMANSTSRPVGDAGGAEAGGMMAPSPTGSGVPDGDPGPPPGSGAPVPPIDDGAPPPDDGSPPDPNADPPPPDPIVSPPDPGDDPPPVINPDDDGNTRTVEITETKFTPPEPEKDYTEVTLHYGTDRAQIDSVWSLVKRDFRLVGIIGLIALLTTLLYKRIVSAPLRKVRWVVYILVWGAFLYGLPSAVQGSWIAYERHKELGVWYGKTRNTTSADGFEVGTCVVTIPEKREVGSVTHPNWWNGEWTPDPSKHFTMSKLTPQSQDEFFDLMKQRVAQADQDSVLVFVHGYNNRFEHAAFRCAQIVHDLKYPGVAVFWSWPSQGEEEGYLTDKTEAERSVSRLAEFLRMIKKRSGGRRMQLLAHSMGSWVLTRAVMKLDAEQANGEKIFDTIVLGAPDIDADTFKNEIAPELAERARLLTIYASRNDPALKISEVANGYPRIGDVNPDPEHIPGVDTIDVSEVCSGHSYIGDNGRVLADLRMVLTLGEPAELRCTMVSTLLTMELFPDDHIQDPSKPLAADQIKKVWRLIGLH